MTEPILLGVLESQIHPARLKILEVRTARYFEIRLLSRRPNLQVVSLRRAEPEIARAQFDHAIMQPEQLQHPPCLRRQRFMFGIGFFRRRDLH